MVFGSEVAAIGRVSARVLTSGRSQYAGSVNAIPILHDLVVLSEPSKYCLRIAAKRRLASILEGDASK